MVQNFDNFFGNLIEAVAAVRDGKIEYCNSAAEKAGLACGKAITDFVPQELLDFASGSFSSSVILNGLQAAVTVKDADGYRIFTFITLDSEQLASATRFLDTAGNAIRNELAVIKLSSEMILPDIYNSNDKKMRKYASTMQHSYYRLLRITNNITSMSQIKSPADWSELIAVDIVEICRDLTETVAHLFKGRGFDITFESNCPMLYSMANKERLEQMILNLFSNSIKYIGDGGHISLTLKKQDKWYSIIVTDDGCGIPANGMSTVWNRYSLPKNTRDENSGMGIGLSIVQKIARMHGGSAFMESGKNGGICVTVSLPVNFPPDVFKCGEVPYCEPGIKRILTELSDVLTYDNYSENYLD